jgi:anhydro-N-acetylmuramic acid kinase
MSGTSMDGIDAVAITVNPDNSIELLHGLHHPIPGALATTLQKIATDLTVSLEELSRADVALGVVLAKAVDSLLQVAQLRAEDVAAIGSHGQTVFHGPSQPNPCTLQIGDPNVIAERTGIITVGDFRRRDMAAGGEGAPLLPAFHQTLFASQSERRIVLNLGGIANITILAQAGDEPTAGFDTGPGNTLLDGWTKRHLGSAYDEGGEWARSGDVSASLLHQFMEDAYFGHPPPKSTGRELFNMRWLDKHLAKLAHPLAEQDVQRTLARLTATSVHRAIDVFAPKPDRLLVAGGGAHNRTVMDDLRELLEAPVESVDALGVPGDFLEAMAFAWFAKCRVHDIPATPPAVTGARQAVVLGAVYAGGSSP